jgi:hypothetical protein
VQLGEFKLDDFVSLALSYTAPFYSSVAVAAAAFVVVV